jgi:hypothetical protein
LRGMHFQRAPHSEAKLVMCILRCGLRCDSRRTSGVARRLDNGTRTS